MSEMLLIHDDEWSTIVRILRRIDEFTTDILLCEPDGKPDYELMDGYIRSLRFSRILEEEVASELQAV